MGAASASDVTERESAFADLQAKLRRARWPDGDGRPLRHVVSIPSINLDSTLMQAHAGDLAVLEERGLWWILGLRSPWVRVTVVLRRPVPAEVVDYYIGLMPDPATARQRLEIISLDDDSTRPLSELLLERPELLARLREAVGADPTASMIMPFNATPQERDVALALNTPIYGVDHRYAAFGRKSAGRKLFKAVGVPCAPGVEDVRTPEDVARAIDTLRPPGDVVVKLDDSVYGEGNVKLAPGDDPAQLDPSYLEDLARLGGVVEQWVDGERVESPSVQLRILPEGDPLVISTHDQILGGANGQQFVACRFPADAAYHDLIVDGARRIGHRLAEEGVIGRFGVDFVVVRDGARWQAYAMEMNLREGGTSHPYGTLWFLTEGDYDPDRGAFVLANGGVRAYVASDNVRATAGDAGMFLATVERAEVGWDHESATGTAFHMFGGLAAGRIAAVTVGETPEDAAERHARMQAAVG